MNRLLCLLAMPQAHRCKGEEGCRKQLDEDEAAHGGVHNNETTTAMISPWSSHGSTVAARAWRLPPMILVTSVIHDASEAIPVDQWSRRPRISLFRHHRRRLRLLLVETMKRDRPQSDRTDVDGEPKRQRSTPEEKGESAEAEHQPTSPPRVTRIPSPEQLLLQVERKLNELSDEEFQHIPRSPPKSMPPTPASSPMPSPPPSRRSTIASVTTITTSDCESPSTNLPEVNESTKSPSIFQRWLTPLSIYCFFALYYLSSYTPSAPTRRYPNIINSTPSHVPSNLTLRQVLQEPFALAMAPAFFGFYAYFGMLDAWPTDALIEQVAGSSAGAMAAVLLASHTTTPKQAADFCANVTLSDFADFPGVGAWFVGDAFEALLQEFLGADLQLQDAPIPIAVTAFDLQTLSETVLTKGSMAKAARASATFPTLFQPVAWYEDGQEAVLIDGGVTDWFGLSGLRSTRSKRVVNLIVGSSPISASFRRFLEDDDVTLVTVSMRGLPQPYPWALAKGPMAFDAARDAMEMALDVPLFFGSEANHLELHIDATRTKN